MTDSEMAVEALRRVQPAAHSALCYAYLAGFAALDARDKVRKLDYALQDLRYWNRTEADTLLWTD